MDMSPGNLPRNGILGRKVIKSPATIQTIPMIINNLPMV